MPSAPPRAGFRCLSRTDSVPWADPQRPGWRTTSRMVAVLLDAGAELDHPHAVRSSFFPRTQSTWCCSCSTPVLIGISMSIRCDLCRSLTRAAGRMQRAGLRRCSAVSLLAASLSAGCCRTDGVARYVASMGRRVWLGFGERALAQVPLHDCTPLAGRQMPVRLCTSGVLQSAEWSSRPRC